VDPGCAFLAQLIQEPHHPVDSVHGRTTRQNGHGEYGKRYSACRFGRQARQAEKGQRGHDRAE
jgi:hypothetical protein